MNSNWISDYSALKEAVKSRRITGLGLSEEDCSYFNQSANSLHANLKILASAPQSNGLVGSEIARRQVLVDNMKKQIQALASANFVVEGGDSNSQFHPDAAPARASVPNSVWDSSDDLTSATLKHNRGSGYSKVSTSEQGLGQRIMEMTSMHDGILDDIDQGVTRLAEQANLMGEETTMSTKLLDDMEGNVDQAAYALRNETNRAESIKEQVVKLKLYICIAVEVVVIVILLGTVTW